MAKQNMSMNMKNMIDNPLHVENINEITKEKLQNFLTTLPKSEVDKLKAHIAMKQPKNTNGVFMAARAYVYNNYVKPRNEQYGINTSTKEPSFAEFLRNL